MDAWSWDLNVGTKIDAKVQRRANFRPFDIAQTSTSFGLMAILDSISVFIELFVREREKKKEI